MVGWRLPLLCNELTGSQTRHQGGKEKDDGGERLGVHSLLLLYEWTVQLINAGCAATRGAPRGGGIALSDKTRHETNQSFYNCVVVSQQNLPARTADTTTAPTIMP